MEYYTVDKFNRGYNVKPTDQSVEKLEKRVNEIEKIGKMYTVTNTYFSTKGRRIVSAGRAIDKKDVVIKEQLDEAIDKLNKQLQSLK